MPRTQHGALCGDRTKDLFILSPCSTTRVLHSRNVSVIKEVLKSSVTVQPFQCRLGYGLIHRSIVTIPPRPMDTMGLTFNPIHIGKTPTHFLMGLVTMV